MKEPKIRKRFIYLISPNKIVNNNFYNDLKIILNTKKVSFFQLRLKKEKKQTIIKIGKKIKKICKRYNVKLIINNNPIIAKKINADGCHVGQNDIGVKKCKKLLKNKIVGVTCHNSIKLVKKAIKDNSDYIAIGSFFKTKTKKVKFMTNTKILNNIKKITKTPIVAIGGINSSNYKKLLLNNADFLAISGFVWRNKKLKPFEAIKEIK